MSFFSTIAAAFNHGGIWMWAIFFTQVISIAIIAERIFTLYVVRRPGEKSVVKKFEDDIRKGQIEKVITKAHNMGVTHPVSKVVEAGAQAALDMGGREEIQAKMDEVLLHENARLETRTGFLAMLGNVATLLGLLGTIVGMIDSFASVSNANPLEKANLLSQGISMAMYATAYGLITAIPALVMYAVLTNRANKLAEDLNQAALRVFNWLSFNYESVPSRRARAE